ncbi:hypothetical protein BKA82DRAFT_24212 [Pisolithus tinctorius]|nr:hypothetical protein BKA82DRAFT_24212 [Pisolithus tinctorius]
MPSVTGTEAVNAFVVAIRPSFNYILASTALSACLFTLLVALFVFSTRESRRRVVFRLNVFAICLALTLGTLIGLACGKFNHAWKQYYVVAVAFALWCPLLYDSILLTRLVVLYPITSTPPVLTLFLDGYIKSEIITKGPFVQEQDASWYRNPKIAAEWIIQMADNLYTVGLFLYKLHVRTFIDTKGISAKYFTSPVANFVFPLLFNIAQIILIMTDRHPAAGIVIVVINNYMAVMGVLCATLWFSGSEWVRAHSQPTSGRRFSCKPNSEHMRGSLGESGIIGKSFNTLDAASLDAGPARDSRQVTIPDRKDNHTLA